MTVNRHVINGIEGFGIERIARVFRDESAMGNDGRRPEDFCEVGGLFEFIDTAGAQVGGNQSAGGRAVGGIPDDPAGVSGPERGQADSGVLHVGFDFLREGFREVGHIPVLDLRRLDAVFRDDFERVVVFAEHGENAEFHGVFREGHFFLS